MALGESRAIHTGFNQSMTARNYDWTGDQFYFAGQAACMKSKGARIFDLIEARDTRAVVAKIFKAASANRPRLRYGGALAARRNDQVGSGARGLSAVTCRH